MSYRRLYKFLFLLGFLFPWQSLLFAQSNRVMLLNEEWDTYSQTSNRYINGWYFCKSGINDQSIVQRANLHAFLSTGTTEGSGTTVATPWLTQIADTFSFYIYGSNLRGHTAQVEFGFIPDTATITDPSDICALFIPYDTVSLSVSNQWQRTTRDMHPYYAIHGTTHRFAIRLINNYHQELYLDEIRAWIPDDDTSTASCPTSLGRDFWVMFLANGGDQTPHQTLLTAVGDSNASITVSNPSTGWSTTSSLTANQSTQISVPIASSISEQSNTPQTKRVGLHVTSTSSISLYAKNYKFKCNDLTLILPSHALGNRYIMQDYPGDPSQSSSPGPGAEVGFVATLDNTTLTMVLPCNLTNNSALAGDTLTVNLMQGESYQLIANASDSFSGMEVTSNGKPFAAFQGNREAHIPAGYGGADLIYEQAVPVDYWGTTHVVVPSYGRSGDRVRITSSEDNCQVYDNGTFLQTLQKGDTYEVVISGSAHQYSSNKKVCVGRYLRGSQSAGNPGDPASVMIPPVDLGVQHLRFDVPTATDISNHYLNIVARNSYVSGITLDGNSISSQFTSIDGIVSYAQVAVTPGTHLLESPSGPIVADYYGLGNYAGCAALAGRSFCEQEPEAEASCLDETTLGQKFWVAFTPNAIRLDNGQSNTTAVLSLIATGSQSASVTITNSETGWSQTFTHNGGDKTYMQLPSHWDNTSVAPTSMCYQVVSTQPISLFASNFFKDSWDVCNVMPERALGTHYIIQDLSLPDNPFSPCLAIAASQDSTTVSCVLPTQVFGSSLGVGDTLTVTLQQGQSLMLRSTSATTFCGMPVTSDKPIAVFQGHSCALVGAAGGRDLLLEQARPVETWGTQFVATSTLTRTEGDVVLVTASADNCTVEINGTVVATLAARQTYSYTLPSSSQAAFITTSQPAYACLYPWSYNNGRTLGDPSSISLNPVDRWICEAWFPIHNCNTNPYDEQYIASNHHYLNIAVPTSATDSMFLDNTPITGFSPIGTSGYSFARQAIAVGAHHLRNPQGNFFASAYGLGKWVCYGFEIGSVVDTPPLPPPPPQQIIHDTLTYSDSVCMGQAYLLSSEIVCGGETYFPPEGLIYVRPAETATAGTLERWSNWVVDDTVVHHIHLTLTVLPSYSEEVYVSLPPGESVSFADTLIADTGTWVFHYTTVGGCDSTVTLHVQDCEMEVCVEVNRDFIDFDHPVVTLHDCSPDRYSSTWVFSDGYTLNGERARRQFVHPLPDTVTVTLRSCNRYGCCADTTIGFRPLIRSVWFPNVFIPDGEQNNRFGAVTSCQVAEFELFVYNRWGLLVYHTTDILALWDGTRDGVPLSQGAYAYRWYLKDVYGDRWSGTGTVTLLR